MADQLIEFKTSEGNKITLACELETVKDIVSFSAKLGKKVKGIRKVLPEIFAQKIVSIRIVKGE